MTRSRGIAGTVSAVAVLALAAACSSTPVSAPNPGAGGVGGGVGTSSPPAPPPKPLHVVHFGVPKTLSAGQAITVAFNAPLSQQSALPTITPRVDGKWQISGRTATFTPVHAYPPSTKLSIKVPSGQGGVTSAAGGKLPRNKTRHPMTSAGSVTDAEQILARLRYVPLTTTAKAPQGRAAATKAVFNPPAGHFAWRYKNTPATLTGLWSPTSYNTILKGALVAFQHQAGIAVDGLLGPQTWRKLLKYDAEGKTDPNAYTYISANLENRPQMLYVWKAGSTVITSPTNGGVPGALTPVGTFPIYERLTTTTMSGTNPDGTKYSDPGVRWVNYFSGGSAVHGFPRASYGTPQSVGCLELPIPTAERVFDTVNYGTLVTVINTT